MNYELAKQLKDAGFLKIILCGREDAHEIKGCGECDAEHYPTLSELIEACPKLRKLEDEKYDGYLALHARDNGWEAGYTRFYAYEGYYMEIEQQGSSPEEAVAKLWLELNKKKFDCEKKKIRSLLEQIYL